MDSITLKFPAVLEFGKGRISKLAQYAAGCQKAFMIIDKLVIDKVMPIIEHIEKTGTSVKIFSDVVPEPPIESLEELLEPVRRFDPDIVAGIGGGSTMDLAKLISVLAKEHRKPQEIIGTDRIISRTVKLILAATTAGTGSEVTPIAVLTDTGERIKKGVVSSFLIPDVSIVDPELTTGVPPQLTATTGIDAMAHCIEAYTNRLSHPVVDNFALKGIRLIADNLETAVNSGHDIEARSALALGSTYGGLCLGPVNTAAVHAMAYPLGGEFKLSHGMSISVLLPYVMQYNLPSCINKYAEIGRLLGVEEQESEEKTAVKAVCRLKELLNRLKIPTALKELNIPGSAIPSMAKTAMKVTRLLSNNPRSVTKASVEAIFRQAYEGVLSY